jgi:hypothetical protein
MPKGAAHQYPSDGADFGRCYRLLLAAPEARAGLDKLATDGGPHWSALARTWGLIEAAYLRDLANPSGSETYALMQSILRPTEEADSGIARLGSGATIRFGG